MLRGNFLANEYDKLLFDSDPSLDKESRLVNHMFLPLSPKFRVAQCDTSLSRCSLISKNLLSCAIHGRPVATRRSNMIQQFGPSISNFDVILQLCVQFCPTGVSLDRSQVLEIACIVGEVLEPDVVRSVFWASSTPSETQSFADDFLRRVLVIRESASTTSSYFLTVTMIHLVPYQLQEPHAGRVGKIFHMIRFQ